MRRNTKSILLAHFSGDSELGENTRRTYQFLYNVFSDVSPEGIRSVTNLLVKKKYLARYQLEGYSVFELTQTGLQKLLAEFPILKQRSRKKVSTTFQLCVFLDPPDSDQGFRKLRRYILQIGGTSLSRGNYIIPSQVTGSVFYTVLLSEYSSSVVLIDCLQFSLGQPEQMVSQKQQQIASSKTLSSISDEAMRLLNNTDLKKDSSFKLKYKISAIFNQLVAELANEQQSFPGQKSESTLYFQAFNYWSLLIQQAYFSRS